MSNRKVLGKKSNVDLELLLSSIDLMMNLSNRYNSILKFFEENELTLDDELYDKIKEHLDFLTSLFIKMDDTYVSENDVVTFVGRSFKQLNSELFIVEDFISNQKKFY